MQITVYKNYLDKNPNYLDAQKMLERIKSCKIKPQIDAIRNETDEKKKKDLKNQLPCILWSGVFSERKDKALQEHSGLVVLDFDKLENVNEFKHKISDYPFVFAAFISPSGDGLKVVVKIPPIIEKHRGYYRGLMKIFKTLDPTSINESRICFESIDPEIFINSEAVEFTDYVEDYQKAKPLGEQKQFKSNDYAKANIALEMIRSAVDGEKHHVLLKSSKLMGGYISGGFISEQEAYRLLETEISFKDIDDIKQAKKTIQDGIEHGKMFPIEETTFNQKSLVKTQINENNVNEFIADEKEVDEYLTAWRNGTFEKGITTGLPSLDKFFLFKRGNYNVINGFDNVGKSTTLWYLALLSALYHNWNWVIFSFENRNGAVIKRLIEFYCGEKIEKINELKYKAAKEKIMRHFTVIKNNQMFSFKDVLAITSKLKETKKYDGVLIDPYNALKINLSDNSKLSTHEYHYEAASEMQLYAKMNDICVYLNCHVVTKAMRDRTPPMKADTEGGGKFANKADDFLTIHREVQDPYKWTETQIHVRKIKEIETGGGYTPLEEPFVLKMVNGGCAFVDENGNDAIKNYHAQDNQVSITQIKPNQNFLNPDKFLEPIKYEEAPPF